jgi:hypothetical protein
VGLGKHQSAPASMSSRKRDRVCTEPPPNGFQMTGQARYTGLRRLRNNIFRNLRSLGNTHCPMKRAQTNYRAAASVLPFERLVPAGRVSLNFLNCITIVSLLLLEPNELNYSYG